MVCFISDAFTISTNRQEKKSPLHILKCIPQIMIVFKYTNIDFRLIYLPGVLYIFMWKSEI